MNDTYTKSGSSAEEGSGTGDESEMEATPLKLQFEEGGESDEETENDQHPAPDAGKGAVPNKASRGSKEKGAAGTKKRPPFLEMIQDAITNIADKKGATAQAIKTYMIANYLLSDAVIKRNFKLQMAKGIESTMLIRPKPKAGAKESVGLQGRFKLNQQWLKQQKKLKTKVKKTTSAKTAKVKAAAKKTAAKVDSDKLKSLKEKPYSVKLAQDKVKQARMSLGMSPAVGKKVKTVTKAKAAKTVTAKAKAAQTTTTKKTAKQTKAIKTSPKAAPSPAKAKKKDAAEAKPKKNQSKAASEATSKKTKETSAATKGKAPAKKKAKKA